MSAEQIKNLGKGLNGVMHIAMTLMLGFCTFVLNEMWDGWKKHEERDSITATTVALQGQQLQAVTQDLTKLNSKVDEIVYLKTTRYEKD